MSIALSWRRLAGPILFGSTVAASWIALIQGAGTGMDVAALSTWQLPPPLDRHAHAAHWTVSHAVTMAMMWWIMMLAMMLPGVAAPTWRQTAAGARWRDGLRFCLGYAAGWLAFSVAAAATQAVLERAGLVDGMTMWSVSAGFSSLLLVGAGLYQISETKARVLARCRARSGNGRPGTDGFRHAAHCMMNCVPLMSLLFVGGVMNLTWIVALSAINLAERSVAAPRPVSKGVGVACILAALSVAGNSG